jgi:7 transmembrane helices usually fused to an inactive transglutaminase
MSSTLVSPTALQTAQLLGALPIGAAFVVTARTVFGMRTVGVFAPALLAITVIDLGLIDGLHVVMCAAIAGLLAIPLIERLAMPRVARLGLLLCVICAVLQIAGFADDQRAALPVVVMAVIIERGWDAVAGGGWAEGSRLIGVTVALAAGIALAISSAPVQNLLGSGGLGAPIAGGLLIALAGSYRGLRLGERRRFRTLLAGAEA